MLLCYLLKDSTNENNIHVLRCTASAPQGSGRFNTASYSSHQEMRTSLAPYDAVEMEAFAVSRRVNSPENEGAELLEAV